MNILLWVLQILLALWNVAGGLYTLSNFNGLKSSLATNLPKPVWVAIAVLQIFFAVALVMPRFSSYAAIYLAANALLGCALFAAYAGFPGILWGIVPAILAGFVAYGRIR